MTYIIIIIASFILCSYGWLVAALIGQNKKRAFDKKYIEYLEKQSNIKYE